MVHPRPIRPDGLISLLVELTLTRPTDRVRVAVDGMPEAGGRELADALVAPLRERGRPVVRVRATDFLRPASVRVERGRRDPDALYDDALDVPGLLREVLVPLRPEGGGRYLRTLWDAERDRATRAAYETAEPRAVLVVDGSFLLKPPLPPEWDLTVHVALSPAARRRRVAAEDAWRLAAFERYDADVRPQDVADVWVRMDDPAHPAAAVHR